MILKTRMYTISLVLIVVGEVLLLSSGILMVILMFWPWTVADETFVIPPLSARAICGSFPSGTVLTIYVDVLSGGNRDINLWIMDEEDYHSFIAGRGYSYYTAFPRVSKTTIEWSPPPNRRICIVYDNTFSIITSKTVYTKIARKLYTWDILLAGGVLLVAGLVMLVVYMYRQKSGASQTQKLQIQPS